jgi:hypothetical protein
VQPREVVARHFVEQPVDEQKLLARDRPERLWGLRLGRGKFLNRGHTSTQ